MHNAVGESLHRCVQNSNKSSKLEETEAGRNLLIPLRRSHEQSEKVISSYHQKLSWHLCFLCVSQLFHQDMFVRKMVSFYFCVHTLFGKKGNDNIHAYSAHLAISQMYGRGNLSQLPCMWYSGAKKYLVSHQLCKFSHLKRWERPVIFIIGIPQLWETKWGKKIQKITLSDF